MRCKLWSGCLIALSLMSAALPVSAQAVYDARQDRPSLSVGAGFSASNQDWGPHTVFGTTGYIDWRPGFFTGPLTGFGLEVMGRDLSEHRLSTTATLNGKSVPIKPRTDTIGGGLIYHVHQQGFYKFEPYIKALGSFGSIDYSGSGLLGPRVYHDTRTVVSLGGGLDWNVQRRITVRGEFEYQIWPDFLGAQLNPVVFTGGVLYRFGFHH
jgi:opacity protein-like surface antigen